MTPESIQLECEARQRRIDQQWAELPYLYVEACREGRATPIQKTKAASSRPLQVPRLSQISAREGISTPSGII
jgi:hypothetical protein